MTPTSVSSPWSSVKDGVLETGQKIRLMATGAVDMIERVGVFTPKATPVDALRAGEIGFITAGIKAVADCRVGDTVTEDRRPAAEPLRGFKPIQPVVFCSLFPTDAADFERLRDSLAKLRLNDASFEYEPEPSVALGFGFRCGFLSLLHLDRPRAADPGIQPRPVGDRPFYRLLRAYDQRLSSHLAQPRR